MRAFSQAAVSSVNIEPLRPTLAVLRQTEAIQIYEEEKKDSELTKLILHFTQCLN